MTSSFNRSAAPRQEALFYRIATAGAELRAVASAAREGAFRNLSIPRSAVVLVASRRGQLAAETARRLADGIRCPLTIARTLPNYVGVLDLVIVCDDNPASHLASALAEADRRGATTAVIDSGAGPLRAAAGRDTVVIPRPAMTDAVSFTGYVGAIAAVLTECGATTIAPAGVIEEVADAVDSEIAACSPQRDPAVNPAQQAADWLSGRRVLEVGAEPLLEPVAEMASVQMLEVGRVAAATSASELSVSITALLAADPQSTRDVFYDPYIDGEVEGQTMLPLGAIILATPSNVDRFRDMYAQAGWARVECPALDVEMRHPLVEVCTTAVRGAAIAALSA